MAEDEDEEDDQLPSDDHGPLNEGPWGKYIRLYVFQRTYYFQRNPKVVAYTLAASRNGVWKSLTFPGGVGARKPPK